MANATRGHVPVVGRTHRTRTIALATCLLLTGACGASGGTSGSGATSPDGNAGAVQTDERPVTGGKLVYGLGAETNGWNPAANQFSGAGLTVARTFFDPLAAFAQDLSVHPFLAERFEHNAAYTEWTITLRPGTKLHNGRTLTADMVKRNQEQLKSSPVTKGAYTLVDGYTAADDLHLRVHLNEPWVTYPSSITGQFGMIADPDWLVTNDGLHPIGTGPFVFDEWVPGSKLVVRKNPDYWLTDAHGTRYPYLDEVQFEVITDGASRSASLRSGGADLIQIGDPAQLAEYRELAARGEYQVLGDDKTDTGEVFVQLNTAVAPFDDIDARRALAYGTDRQGFIDTVSEGAYRPADGPFSPSSKWYAPTGYPDFDAAAARQHVEKVKARNNGAFTFTLYGTPGSGLAMQYLQQRWAEIGIDAKLEEVEQAKLIIQVVVGSYQATMWAQFDSPDPLMDSIFWSPEENRPIPEFSLNFARFGDPGIGAALRDARQTTDKAREVADYQEVSRRLAEGLPYIWLYHGRSATVATNRIVNVTNYRLPDGAVGLSIHSGAHPLHQVWIKR